MRRTLLGLLAVALVLSSVVATLVSTTGRASAATLTRVTGFGANPADLGMYPYVPDDVAPRPAQLVLVHYCGGSAGAVFGGNGRDFVTAADRHGYLIVLPEATRDGHCFDVSTPVALTRDGGGDSTGIMAMVGHVRQRTPSTPAASW
jgi:poly(3-hydroxybutyrate) depolymerase